MNSLDFAQGGAVMPLVPQQPRTGGEGQGHALVTQLLSVVRRRKWIIAGCVALCVLAGFIVTLLTTPQYTATTTVEIQRESESVVNVDTSQPKTSYADQEFYQTQYGLLQARSLADRVAGDLRLYDNPQFFEMFRAKVDWFQAGRLSPAAPPRVTRQRVAGDILLGHFVLKPERMSRLVALRFTSPQAGFSKEVVDRWAADFIQMTLERRYGATAYARQFLEGRLEQLRRRIDESERRLVAYAGQQGIVNLPVQGTSNSGDSGERSLVVEDLTNYNRALAEATADRVLAQSRLGAQRGQVAEALNNAAINALRQRRAELAADYARLMVQFEPGYPAAKALQTQLRQIDAAITTEEARVRSTLQQTFQATAARETALQQRVDALKSGVLDYRRRSIQYGILQRDVDTSRQLYDALLQRYKTIGVAGGVGVNNISIVDFSELPTAPSSPRLMLNLALALLAGLTLGAAAALVAEQLDQGVSDPAEVEEALRAPLLGIIPRAAGDAMALLNDRKSAINEAYFSMQTNLAFTTSHGLPRTLTVTSSRPGEGKSTTSYALARLLARSSRKVVLIDADMRSPSIHHLIGIANGEGLSNYLTGDHRLGDFTHPSGFENLSVITAGPHPPSAPELLSGDQLHHLVDELGPLFDHIIFDSPPVMGLADAPLLGGQAEGTVFVVEAHGTQKTMAGVAVGRLRAAGVNLLGVVLTKFDSKRAHFGYGYEYGYGYGYGQDGPSKAA